MNQAPKIGARTALSAQTGKGDEHADEATRTRLRKPVAQVVAEKREWHYRPTFEERAKGFKGWHSRSYLPHFDAPGVRQFITYRLADSIPVELAQEWAVAMKLEDAAERFRRMEKMLDQAHGECALRNPLIEQMIQDNFWFHDGNSYRLLAWVIMPNHVHICAEMYWPLDKVLKNWKSYSASQANKFLGRVRSSFWQADYFDRYVRDEEHFRRVVHYIENNPVKSRLVREPKDWPWSSAKHRGIYGSDEPPQIVARRAFSAETNKNAECADKAVRAPMQP